MAPPGIPKKIEPATSTAAPQQIQNVGVRQGFAGQAAEVQGPGNMIANAQQQADERRGLPHGQVNVPLHHGARRPPPIPRREAIANLQARGLGAPIEPQPHLVADAAEIEAQAQDWFNFPGQHRQQ